MENVFADGTGVSFKEIICKKPTLDNERQPILLEDGTQRFDYCVQYYTFFGHSEIVEGHYARTFVDMRDRLIGGFDQQWAYATFLVPIMAKYAEQGVPMEAYLADYDVEESEEVLEELIRTILPSVVQFAD